ncbi:MAG: YhbD family protein [Oscillospiraceae bacterium]|nr:YhbD family protein [Oscillospiraceae bacterium]
MDLISKKELLETTGISYGQLYRWKREGLLPESWFIKQSSYTGQETFFPRSQALERVKAIMELKDACSLEEIAKILSPEMTAAVSKADLLNVEALSKEISDIIISYNKKEEFTLFEAAFILWINDLKLPAAQIKILIMSGLDVIQKHKNYDIFCTLFEADNKFYLTFHKDIFISFSSNIKAGQTVSLNEAANNIKIKYKEILGGN